ncbi:MAG: phage major capsid protein [Rickettsiales bacterium]|nr:phage major capsid protein [Rickettsiales bacterium]
MSMNEITERVNALGQAWEQFKQVNDARLNEIERKGNADPLYQEHLQKITHALDHHKRRMDTLEVAANRPAVGGVTEAKQIAYEGEYKQAFCSYLRKGMDAGLEGLHTKALSVGGGSGEDGGYLVTPAMSERVAQIINEISPLRELASVTTISTDALDVVEDNELPAAAWVGESATRSDTTTAQIGKHTISTFEMYAQPKATQKLIDDASIDIEAWLAERVGEKFAALEAAAFVSGNGTSAPKGILSYAAGTASGEIEQIDSGTNGVVSADGLVKLYYALKDEYAKNATFVMNRASIQAVRLLKESTTDQYLWQPGLASGTPDTLMGVPVRAAADMPVPTTDSLSVAVGDFKRTYQIVDRTGIRVLRDPFTDKPFVKFYTTKRVGGEVINTEAVKLLKLSDGA